MKAATFDYVALHHVDDVVSTLSSRDGVKLIAGGQSLGPMLNLRLVRPQLLIDISRVDTMRTLEQRENSLWIGAATTHARLEDETDGMLQHVAAGIAYRAIRNRGTIGGSMAHADPAADWPLALAALGAAIHIRGPAGVRRVAANDFMLAAFTTVLDETEVIEAIEVPRPSSVARWGYYKFCRKTGEFPEASAAVMLDPARRIANVFVGALNGRPRRCDEMAQRLASGENIEPSAFTQTIAAFGDLDAASIRMHAAVLKRAIASVTGS